MKRTLTLLLLGILGLAACAGDGQEPSLPLAVVPTQTLQPTPTLVASLATSQAAAQATTAAVATPALNLARPKPTITPTPTPSPTPTATPLPATRIAQGGMALTQGNAEAAITELEAALQVRPALTDAQVIAVLADLGKAYLQEGEYGAAVGVFNELLGLAEDTAVSAAYFYLGQAHTALGDYRAAIDAYQQYLVVNPEMATYVNPYVAEAYFALGDRQAGVQAYETAVSGAGFRLTKIELRQKLVDFYLADGNYDAAIAQYDAIRDLAVTEATKGRMTYLAGQAEMLAGHPEAAYGRYLLGVDSFPRAYESYLGLVELVEAGVPVDEFQRGLVDYYAAAYYPAIEAFQRYLAANSDDYRPDTHLYLAWCYEGVSDVDMALAELEQYALSDAADAAIERAMLLARAGNGPAALEAYEAYLTNFPTGEDAAFAAWWSAWWLNRLGDLSQAQARYRFFADTFPDHEDAPEALFRVGLLAEENGDRGTAVSVWLELAEKYPHSNYSGASLVWLLRTLPAETGVITATVSAPAALTATLPLTLTQPISGTEAISQTETVTATQVLTDTAELLTRTETLALSSPGSGYYALRARELAQGGTPFATSGVTALPATTAADRQAAEAWLRGWLGLDDGTPVSALSPVLADDERLVVGGKLWQLGLWEEAKRELEAVRQDYADNALFSYQLALYFRDLGLYRSSILAAETVLRLSGESVFDVPLFLGRLAYPTYYADLVLPLADKYGYDPLLQFSLLRQESLFESFATSTAVAQGLSQVIPDTGAYIARQLAWPDYENADLYKPYVGLNFGAYYLQEQLGLFDGFVAAALSAYNAGPGNALRWYNLTGADHDLYVETVDFSETRLYIERIYSGYQFYVYLYGEGP